MIELILGTAAPYIMVVLGVVAAFFGISSKVKTSTIEKQKEVITNQEVDKVVLLSAISTNEDTLMRIEEANEILSTDDGRNIVIARMRERAASRGNGNKD